MIAQHQNFNATVLRRVWTSFRLNVAVGYARIQPSRRISMLACLAANASLTVIVWVLNLSALFIPRIVELPSKEMLLGQSIEDA